VNRFQFVSDHQHLFQVKRLCEVIGIAKSSYYYWLETAQTRAERDAEDAKIAAKIKDIQDPKKGGDKAYGVPRVTPEINEGKPAEERINHKKIQRIMKKHGLAGIRLRKPTRTTVSDQTDEKFPDLLNRDFTADQPNQKYVGDITYLPLKDGRNLYLAMVHDCGSRKLPGWALADHMRRELVMDALKAANRDRADFGGLRGAIFHSDHGSQYTSNDFVDLCKELGVTQSMGAVGTSADNALAESLNATGKREMLDGRPYFENEAEARRAVFRWTNRFNTKRRHSYCNYDTPNNYEIELRSNAVLDSAA